MGHSNPDRPLDDEERQLAQELEAGEWVSSSDFEATKVHFQAVAHETLTKSARLSIRLTPNDFNALKSQAAREGRPYQTLVSSVIHKYVTGQLIPLPPDGARP
jgi:predicted DNA binding CopG/RHH family protein